MLNDAQQELDEKENDLQSTKNSSSMLEARYNDLQQKYSQIEGEKNELESKYK